MSGGSSIVSGTAPSSGELISFGSQCLHCVRSFAKSQVMSEPTEKWAGAGDDPNGNRVSSTPMSSPVGVGQMAMHFGAILGVVRNLLYAFSMSILFIKITLLGLFHLMLWIRCRKRSSAYPYSTEGSK